MGGSIRRLAIYGEFEPCRKIAQAYGFNHATSSTNERGNTLMVTAVDFNGRLENGRHIEDQHIFVVGDKFRFDQPEAYSTLGVVEDQRLLEQIHQQAPLMPLIFWTSQEPLPTFEDWGVDVLVIPFRSGENVTFSRTVRSFLTLHPAPVQLMGYFEFWQIASNTYDEKKKRQSSTSSSSCCVIS